MKVARVVKISFDEKDIKAISDFYAWLRGISEDDWNDLGDEFDKYPSQGAGDGLDTLFDSVDDLLSFALERKEDD